VGNAFVELVVDVAPVLALEEVLGLAGTISPPVTSPGTGPDEADFAALM
jgi:hypothetical protein